MKKITLLGSIIVLLLFSCVANAQDRRPFHIGKVYIMPNFVVCSVDNQGGEEYWNRLNEIKQPTLIIHGTDYKIWHYKNAGFLQEKIKGSNLITLEGTGHELHVDDWKSIIDGIEKHIND